MIDHNFHHFLSIYIWNTKCYFYSVTSLNEKCRCCLWLLVWKLFSTIFPHTTFQILSNLSCFRWSRWSEGCHQLHKQFFNHFRSADFSCHLFPICICCISRHRSPICPPQWLSCPVHPSFICQDNSLPCLKKMYLSYLISILNISKIHQKKKKQPSFTHTNDDHKHPPSAVQAALSFCWQNTCVAALKRDSWECVAVNKSMGSAKQKLIWKSFFEKMSGPKGSALVSNSYQYTGGMNIWIFSCSLLMFSCLSLFSTISCQRGRVQTGGNIDFLFHFFWLLNVIVVNETM